MQQLYMFGATSGTEISKSYAEGDILQTKPFGRVVVTKADEDAHGNQVLLAIRLDNGSNCVVLAKEVEYRSK